MPGAGGTSGSSSFAGNTAAGVSLVRLALVRLETLVSLALAVSVLVLAEDYLTGTGAFRTLAELGPWPFPISWTTGAQIALAAVMGLAIAVLVIMGIVTAIRGAVAWRRGVLATVRASPEYGPAQVDACRRAREDHSTTLWLFLVAVVTAIAASATFGVFNGVALAAGAPALPASLGSVGSNLAFASVFVAIYYFGARQLGGLLDAIASSNEPERLFRGGEWMIGGAAVGSVTAFSPFFWALSTASVVSYAVILVGAREIRGAYDSWLEKHGPAPVPRPDAGALPA